MAFQQKTEPLNVDLVLNAAGLLEVDKQLLVVSLCIPPQQGDMLQYDVEHVLDRVSQVSMKMN